MRRQARVRNAGISAAGTEDAVVVSYEPGKASHALKKVRERGGRLKRQAKTGGFFVVYVPEGRSAAEFASTLQGIDGVRHAEPDSVVRAALAPNDPNYSSQWNLPRIGAPAAWDITMGSSSVTIAIVDTGVQLTHPDLAGRLDTTNDYDFVNDDSVAEDDQGHGTHCAGIAAASTNNANQVAGVAGECTILPVKVLASDGQGLDSDVADGIKWAADKGADVISLSLESDYYSVVIDDAVQYAVAKDCVVVAASGNDGLSTGVSYPARLPNVLAVGATVSTGERWTSSNYGVGLDLSAPGALILSTTTGGGVGMMSGTSMAAPHVAGVAALVRSQNPTWTRSQVEQRVTSTALDLGSPGFDAEYGYGLVRADAAVTSTTPPPPPDPDDSLPGVDLPASPVTGSVDGFSDVYDVYRIDLSAGQTLALGLTSAAVDDVDLHLYGPEATSLADAPLASSADPESTEAITYVASRSGVYSIAVKAFQGSGSYTLTYSAFTQPPPELDDDIPGVAIGPSPRAGTVDQSLDPVDVYSVSLEAGTRLTVDLTGPAGTDFDVFVFGPEAGSVDSAAPLASGVAGAYPERVRYQVPSSGGGTYYVAVRGYSGSGVYELSYRAEDTIELELLRDGFETWPGLWSPWSAAAATWGQTSYRESAGLYSAYCAGSPVQAPGPYQNNMGAWLTAGPFDLSDYDGATLTFDLWLDSEADVDELSAGASTDDYSYQTMVWSGSTDGWMNVTLDLADLAGDGTLNFTGQSEVWIGFIFDSDASVTYEGAYIDNVRLSGTRIDCLTLSATGPWTSSRSSPSRRTHLTPTATASRIASALAHPQARVSPRVEHSRGPRPKHRGRAATR